MTTNANTETPSVGVTAPGSAAPEVNIIGECRKPRSRRKAKRRALLARFTGWLSTEHAAEALDLSITALRARIQRAPEREYRGQTARDLGGGVFACKLGSTWRLWIPPTPTVAP